MNDSLIRKFCESRYRWPIVATATTLLALATVMPQVDDYFDKRNSRNELADNLDRARETASTLPTYQQKAAEVDRQLEALEVRTVDEQRLAAFRNRVMEFVRDAGCQVRQLDVGPPSSRPWRQGDDPLNNEGDRTANAAVTPFNLESRTMMLTVDGSMAAVHDLLARLEKEQTLAHPHRVRLQPATADGETVTLELELRLFALARGKT